MSGYGGTIEVVNLKPNWKSFQKELSNIMHLNATGFKSFFEDLGFNFQIIFDWLKYQDKSKVEPFIRDEIQKKKEEIDEIFEKNDDLKEKILGKEPIEKIQFRMEELDFLQKKNIIIMTADMKNGWHDRLVEKAFEELKKKK